MVGAGSINSIIHTKRVYYSCSMTKRINIILPERTIAVLDRVTTKGTRSRFVDRAVLHYVESQGKASLRQQLIEGYRAAADDDLAIAAAWFPLEEEVSEEVPEQVLDQPNTATLSPKSKSSASREKRS